MTSRSRTEAAPPPLNVADIERLQALLDALPAPLEPLDVSMLDGYLCGVLLQPQIVAAERWLAHVYDADGRALPAGVDSAPLAALLRRRHAELDAAIARRQWFDPWVYELEAEPGDDDDPFSTASQAVYPWVAGFAAAMELFPGLMALHARSALEPLALLYRHLDPEDLEDADELLALIESIEPPADLEQATEELVRATLLLADVSRPQAGPPQRRPTQRPQSRRR